jgi:cell division protein FtsL
VGIIPGSLIFALAGKQLGIIESVEDLFSFNVIMMFLLLILLACIPMMYTWFYDKK